MNRFGTRIGVALTIGLSLTLMLLWLMSKVSQAAQAGVIHYVAIDCIGVPAPCYTAIQAAVDAAAPGDEIRVAAGNYTGVSTRDGETQVVYLDKSITIRGGYTTTNNLSDPPNPETNLTVLDAQSWGRVLYIAGNITPVVEGLRIIGGDAAGLGGGAWGEDAGGGIYVITATAIISNNQVFHNSADRGGGLYVYHSDAVLYDNTIISNTAQYGGGGLYLYDNEAALIANQIINNNAYEGGGAYLYEGSATLDENAFFANSGKLGGGVFLLGGDMTLTDNTIISNTADFGGGAYLDHSHATFSGNSVISNYADWQGGGLYLNFDVAVIGRNDIAANSARLYGGGIYAAHSDVTLSGNTLISNTATLAGGGLHLNSSDATLVNSVVADNRAGVNAPGIYVLDSSPHLLHNTIARNDGGDGSGVFVTSSTSHSSVVMANTILVSHTVGVTVTTGNTATLQATLWGDNGWENNVDWGGAGMVITGTLAYNYWKAPAFVAPDAGDYHITLASAALDTGINAGINTDIDNDPRPQGSGYDLGADETGLVVTKQANPDPVRPGGLLTYAIHITNTSSVTLTATVTDVLPGSVTPGGIRTWTPITIASRGIWLEQIDVTVIEDYTGSLNNVVWVTTEEGASGVYTETSTVSYTTYLPLVLRSSD